MRNSAHALNMVGHSSPQFDSKEYWSDFYAGRERFEWSVEMNSQRDILNAILGTAITRNWDRFSSST